MSRTDIDAATFANYLRQMCGDGSVEWCYEPMQTSVLLDIADLLDENAKLRHDLEEANNQAEEVCIENEKLRGLVRDMFYAVHPADREKFLTNVAELGVDDG